MLHRHATSMVLAALADTPVVALEGARQVGKSTLAQALVAEGILDQYVTFDDMAPRSAAQADPDGFVAGLPSRVVLDEVQRVPAVLTAIKASVDRGRTPGRFLITGSAAVLGRPGVAESLAGRMERIAMAPFSQGELAGVRESFIDRLFESRPGWEPAGRAAEISATELGHRIATGGFPEVVGRRQPDRKRAWLRSYVDSLVERDLRELARIEGQSDVSRLLALLAARSGTLVNMAEIGRSLGMPQTTLKRYLTLLEMLFVVQPVPAWTANIGKRMVRAPRMSLVDTGLACALLGYDAGRLVADSGLFAAMLESPLLESFVAIELRKQASWSRARPGVYHFRTHAQQEVDLVLEDGMGRIVGVEVKNSRSLGGDAAKGLRTLEEMMGEKFLRGVILHTGPEVVPFAERIHAVPLTEIWQGEKVRGGRRTLGSSGRGQSHHPT